MASVDGQAITLAGQQGIVHGPHICRNSIVGGGESNCREMIALHPSGLVNRVK